MTSKKWHLEESVLDVSIVSGWINHIIYTANPKCVFLLSTQWHLLRGLFLHLDP